MNFGEFLDLHLENIKKLIRKIENLENKLANARVAIVFNKACLIENLLPTFTNIYIKHITHNTTLYAIIPLYTYNSLLHHTQDNTFIVCIQFLCTGNLDWHNLG